MWVSRAEWESLKRRVDWLEKERVSKEETTFTVFDKSSNPAVYYDPYRTCPNEKVPVKTAIERIMDKLGMKFEYVKGTPARVDLSSPSAASHAGTEDK